MAEADERIWGRPQSDNAYRGAAVEDDVAANQAENFQQKRTSNITSQQAALARPQPTLTKSKNIGSEIPRLGDSGPIHDILKIEHKGPIELLWAKIKAFVASLDNTDVMTTSDDGKIQAYHYALPRYVLFRIQIFQNPDTDLPFVVEFQRREGDAYIHSVLFQHLRAVLADSGGRLMETDNAVDATNQGVSTSPYEILTPSAANENFQGLDLRQSEEDLNLWIRLLCQPNLLSTQSASGCLAMATRTETNLPYLIKAADGILKGFRNCLKHSEDPPTLFACSVVLSTLSANADWCQALVKSGIVPLLVTTILKWKGTKLKSKRTVINLLLTIRCLIERVGRDNFIRTAGDTLNRLHALLKSPGLETDVSVLLQSIFQLLQV